MTFDTSHSPKPQRCTPCFTPGTLITTQRGELPSNFCPQATGS